VIGVVGERVLRGGFGEAECRKGRKIERARDERSKAVSSTNGVDTFSWDVVRRGDQKRTRTRADEERVAALEEENNVSFLKKHEK